MSKRMKTTKRTHDRAPDAELATSYLDLAGEAVLAGMMREGVPLGAVAAALASPETAERIALMEAATGGGLSPLDAARLSLRRAGQDATVLDGLLAPAASVRTDAEIAEELLAPLGLSRLGSVQWDG